MSDIANFTNLYRIVNLLRVGVVFYIWKSRDITSLRPASATETKWRMQALWFWCGDTNT